MKYLYISRIGRSWYAYAGDEMKGYVFPIGADIDKRAAIARWDAAGIQTVSRASPTKSSAESRAKNAQEKTGLSYKGVWGDSSIPPDAALPNYARVLRESRLKVNLAQRRVAELSHENEYGITLVSLDEGFRARMEPGAATYANRLAALRALHDAGCNTWISIEPYPTPNLVEQDINDLLAAVSFADKIIFGRTNYSKAVTAYTKHKAFYNDQAQVVIAFCEDHGIAYHIKEGTITE